MENKTKRTRQARETKEKLVEIARSFSYKHNAGRYESQDFFCSQKTECKESEANEVSERLYIFCKENVIRDLNNWIKEKEEKEKQKVEEVYKKAHQEVVEPRQIASEIEKIFEPRKDCETHDHAPHGECLVVEWQGSGQDKSHEQAREPYQPTEQELLEMEQKEAMAEMARESKKD